MPDVCESSISQLQYRGLRLIARAVCLVLALVVSVLSVNVYSAPANAADKVAMNSQYPKQDMALLKTKVADFLQMQAAGYPGKVTISVGTIDANLRLAACADVQAFLPSGSRAWGKTSVGLRCSVPSAWTIYVQSTVSVMAQYLVAAVPLAQGHAITSQDLIFEVGDLTQLPAGIYTSIDQAVGRIVNISMMAGTILRQEMVKIAPIVQQGQTVMISSGGKGFRVTAEGKALTKANEGQLVQVKVASGQVVTGVVRQGGQIEVGF